MCKYKYSASNQFTTHTLIPVTFVQQIMSMRTTTCVFKKNNNNTDHKHIKKHTQQQQK